MKKSLVNPSVDRIENAIRTIRGEKIILDADLAELYDVETRALLQAIKRNSERFPADFMFQLSDQEFEALRSQIVISKHRGGICLRCHPRASRLCYARLSTPEGLFSSSV